MFTGRDILYISSIEWNFLWQTHQEIALRLAAAGNRVLYLENTGVRSPRLREIGRVARRLKRWARTQSDSGRKTAENIHLCSPLVMPPFGPQWQRQANRRIFIPRLLRLMKQLQMRDVIVWTYLPNDTALDLIDALGKDIAAVVYYCVADFAQLAPQPEKLREAEQQLVKRSDLVFANCSSLVKRFQQSNPNTHLFPVGVNLDAFPINPVEPHSNGNRSLDPTSPACVATLPRPLIGYVGGMHRHIDFELLKSMALARPDWSWVFVGPAQTDVQQLAALPNVYLVGQRPHEELINYIRQFDVCTVPYLKNSCTETVVPTKINEYLAVSKPVVSTSIPTVIEFNERHKVLITSEPQPHKFLIALETALVLPNDEKTRARRRHVAEQNDWTKRFSAMCELIDEQITRKQVGGWRGDSRSASA